MATAEIAGDRIEVTLPRRMKDLVAEIPGSRFVPDRSVWRLPLTFNAVVQLYGQFSDYLDDLDLSDELQAKVGDWKADEDRLSDLHAAALDPSRWEARGSLYEFQPSAVDFLDAAGSGILGDDPGTGKTEMAAAWLGDPSLTLVITPRAVQGHWLKRLRAWYPDHEHVVLPVTAAARRKAIAAYRAAANPGALIVTYSQLPLHSRLASYGSIRLEDKEKQPKEFNEIEWRAIVADEAHRMFNPKTKWTRAAWWLGDSVERRLALTGTPAENSPLDFWALLRFVAPDEWPSRSKFQDMYCRTYLNFWGGAESITLLPEMKDEFYRLANRRFVRRTKALVLPHLPRKVYETRTVDLPPKLRKQYDALKADMETELADGQKLSVFNSAVLWSRLSQAAAAQLEITGTHEVERNGETLIVDDVRMVEPSPKVDELIATMDDLGRPPVAVFARARQLLELASARLEKLGIGHVKIVGGMHAIEIEEAKDAFNDGRADVILISLGASAEGLSLTRGSTEIWVDRSYAQRENLQGEDRMHGTGRGDQEADHLLIVDLIAADTVEERRVERLGEKADNFADLFPDPADMLL